MTVHLVVSIQKVSTYYSNNAATPHPIVTFANCRAYSQSVFPNEIMITQMLQMSAEAHFACQTSQ